MFILILDIHVNIRWERLQTILIVANDVSFEKATVRSTNVVSRLMFVKNIGTTSN